jgi:uncharacterized membrane protein YadS
MFVADKTLFPGLLSAVTVALAAKFVSECDGAPVMLMALLIGMAFVFLAEERSNTAVGIEFASKKVLRFGVDLLGLGITFQQIIALGAAVLVLAICAVILTILLGLALSYARVVLIRKFEAIFSKNRWFCYSFRIKTLCLRYMRRLSCWR